MYEIIIPAFGEKVGELNKLADQLAAEKGISRSELLKGAIDRMLELQKAAEKKKLGD